MSIVMEMVKLCGSGIPEPHLLTNSFCGNGMTARNNGCREITEEHLNSTTTVVRSRCIGIVTGRRRELMSALKVRAAGE
jgi:hypothetical protein